MNEQDQVALNKQVQCELEEVRREAAKAYSLDTEIDPVPDSAYDDLCSLLVLLPEDIPAPDPGWAEDGSLSLKWRPENGIVTMVLFPMINGNSMEFAHCQTLFYCRIS